MSTLKRLKNLERSFSARLLSSLSALLGLAGRFFGSIRASNGKRLSFLVVPHSGRPARSVGIGYPLLAIIGLALILAAGFGIFSALRYSALALELTMTHEKLESTQGNLDDLRDEAGRLSGSARRFEKVLVSAIMKSGLPGGLPASEGLGEAGVAGDVESTGLREIGELSRLSTYLDSASDPLSQIASLMENQGRVMNEIPNIWPIKGGIGHISMYFGQNEHPFSGQWYIHNGIDISNFRSGDPILATADGKVIQTGYDSGLGNYLILQHSHGFFTRYGHLQSFRVARGQKVQQGQAIATLGNTGKSTGPHLHYEVHLGTSVIDPLKFLNIRAAKPAGTGSPAGGM